MTLKKISTKKMGEITDIIYKQIRKKSYQDVLNTFEKWNIDVHTVDTYGQTILWALASILSKYSTPRFNRPILDGLSFLLEQGSDINHRDVDGNTVLWLVAHCSVPEGIEPLIKGGAIIDNVNNIGATPLYAAIVSFEDNYRECFTLLLKAGADPFVKMNVEKFYYKSPFDFAMRHLTDKNKTLKEKFIKAMKDAGYTINLDDKTDID